MPLKIHNKHCQNTHRKSRILYSNCLRLFFNLGSAVTTKNIQNFRRNNVLARYSLKINVIHQAAIAKNSEKRSPAMRLYCIQLLARNVIYTAQKERAKTPLFLYNKWKLAAFNDENGKEREFHPTKIKEYHKSSAPVSEKLNRISSEAHIKLSILSNYLTLR